MRIAGINIFTAKPSNGSLGNNQYDYYRNKQLIAQKPDLFIKTQPHISFTSGPISVTSKITTAKEFKNLATNRIIHCFYCQKPMFSPEFVDDLQDRGVFSGAIIDFITELAPHKNKLKETPLKIFEYFEEVSQSAPYTHLSRALTLLQDDALTKLRKKQIPIFDRIETEVKKLPKPLRTEIMATLTRHRNRMEGIEHVEPFNAKDFAYKMQNVAKTVLNNRHKMALNEYAGLMNNPAFTDPTAPLSTHFAKRIIRISDDFNPETPITRETLQLHLIEQIRKIGTKLDREDILYLSRNAEKMIKGEPVIVKFSNKAFVHDLNKHLLLLHNKTTTAKINQLTSKLPTSDSNINSFITKHENMDSNTIGYDLLAPSIDTIEHMHVRSKKTPYTDTLGNYALACPACNNSRLDKDMAKFLEKFDPTSPQVYFNDIIGIANDGFISLEDLFRMKESIRKESGKVMNASTISTNILKETFAQPNSQERFDHFIKLANEGLIATDDIYEIQKILAKRCSIYVKIIDLNYLNV